MYAGHIKTLNINRNGINGRKEDKTDTRLLLMPFTMDETSLIGQLKFFTVSRLISFNVLYSPEISPMTARY